MAKVKSHGPIPVYVGFFFLVPGLFMLYFAVSLYFSTQDFLTRALQTEATIINKRVESRRDSDGKTSTSTYITVTFSTKQGQTITKEIGGSSSDNHGDRVAILYDPAQPNEVKKNSFEGLWLGPLLLSILGGVFSAVGGGMVWVSLKERKRRRWLKSSGQRIEATETHVERDVRRHRSRSGKRRSHTRESVSYCIVCQWHDERSNRMFTFRSDPLDYDPEGFVSGKTLPVLIDPQDPSRYVVDLSSLPSR